MVSMCSQELFSNSVESQTGDFSSGPVLLARSYWEHWIMTLADFRFARPLHGAILVTGVLGASHSGKDPHDDDGLCRVRPAQSNKKYPVGRSPRCSVPRSSQAWSLQSKSEDTERQHVRVDVVSACLVTSMKRFKVCPSRPSHVI